MTSPMSIQIPQFSQSDIVPGESDENAFDRITNNAVPVALTVEGLVYFLHIRNKVWQIALNAYKHLIFKMFGWYTSGQDVLADRVNFSILLKLFRGVFVTVLN